MDKYSGFNKGNKLKVAVLTDALPFSNCSKDTKPTGVAIKIWEKTADKYDIDYESFFNINVRDKEGYSKLLQT